MKAKHFLPLACCCVTLMSACNNPKNSTASSDSTAATTEAAPATSLITITDKKWKLIELMGQPVADVWLSKHGGQKVILLFFTKLIAPLTIKNCARQ